MIYARQSSQLVWTSTAGTSFLLTLLRKLQEELSAWPSSIHIWITCSLFRSPYLPSLPLPLPLALLFISAYLPLTMLMYSMQMRLGMYDPLDIQPYAKVIPLSALFSTLLPNLFPIPSVPLPPSLPLPSPPLPSSPLLLPRLSFYCSLRPSSLIHCARPLLLCTALSIARHLLPCASPPPAQPAPPHVGNAGNGLLVFSKEGFSKACSAVLLLTLSLFLDFSFLSRFIFLSCLFLFFFSRSSFFSILTKHLDILSAENCWRTWPSEPCLEPSQKAWTTILLDYAQKGEQEGGEREVEERRKRGESEKESALFFI